MRNILILPHIILLIPLLPAGNILPTKDGLSKKEKRAFQRMVTGLTIGNNQNAFMRFMTLTTSKQSTKDINKSFDVLKMRILRAKQFLDGFHGFKFNRYFKLKTKEGNGVLHIVYWGRFIPQEWLSKQWKEIHQSPIVDIRACSGGARRSVKGLVGYLLTNYLTKQPILRMSYGWKWAWLGFCKSWTHVKKTQQFVRRCSSIKDEPKIVWITKPCTTIQYAHRLWTFKLRYRNCVLEYWQSLLKVPLVTSRQIKWCNPDHTRWNRNFSMSL